MTQSAEDGGFTSDDQAHGQPQPPKPSGRWRFWVLAAVVGTLGPIAIELPWREIVFSESERARRDAERDWRQSRAIYARFNLDDPSVERFHDGFMFEYHYHPATRLEVVNVITKGKRTYWHKYNVEVERLIERNGVPPWATKCALPTAEDLTAVMADGALQELNISEIQHAPAFLTHGLMI